MIEAIDLTVRQGGRTVLDAVSFDVRPGQVTGVLGGTAAGKTTLLRRMVQLDRGGGEALFDGHPYQALAHPIREVGLVLGEAIGYPDHTVRGHLRLALATDRRSALESGTRRRFRRFGHGDDYPFGQAGEGVLSVCDAAGNSIALRSGASEADEPSNSGRRGTRRGGERPSQRIDAVLDIVGLSGQRRTRLEDLTDEMATRLAIATALLGDPKALLLDCPDRGLESKGVAWLGDLLRMFTSRGRAALVTCSDTETLVGLADRVLLLDAGCLVGTRTAAEVLRAPSGAAVIVRSPQIVRFAALLAEAGARSSQGEGASLEVRGLDRARIGDLAYRHGVPLHELAERFTGSDPGDVVLATCSGRGRALVPIQTPTRAGTKVGADAGKNEATGPETSRADDAARIGAVRATRADAGRIDAMPAEVVQNEVVQNGAVRADAEWTEAVQNESAQNGALRAEDTAIDGSSSVAAQVETLLMETPMTESPLTGTRRVGVAGAPSMEKVGVKEGRAGGGASADAVARGIPVNAGGAGATPGGEVLASLGAVRVTAEGEACGSGVAGMTAEGEACASGVAGTMTEGEASALGVDGMTAQGEVSVAQEKAEADA